MAPEVIFKEVDGHYFASYSIIFSVRENQRGYLDGTNCFIVFEQSLLSILGLWMMSSGHQGPSTCQQFPKSAKNVKNDAKIL